MTGRRRSRVIRLRRWLLGGTVLFAAGLIAFIGFARYRARKAILNLPHRLGIDIKSETNGFTISRAFKGHTQFVIHAAKAIQHQNGTTTLHDVAITLYGSSNSNPTDSIRGAEFDYDQNHGVLRAMGDTELDIAAPEAADHQPAPDKRIVVHTRGLVILEKLGVASTKEQLRFEYGTVRGEAVGADYERDTGVLMLHHDVHLRSEENGHVEQVDAQSAELQQPDRVAILHGATLRDASQTLAAPMVRVTLRPAGQPHSGTLQQLHATGGVTVHTETGEQIQAPELLAAVDEENKLRALQMQGGVHLEGTGLDGDAQQAKVDFARGRATHLHLDGSAHLHQHELSQQSRTLQAQQIDGDLAPAGSAHLALRQVTATGAATMVLQEPGTAKSGPQSRQLSGPLLIAHSTPAAKGMQLADVQAPRGAHLSETDVRGAQRTSSSARLLATFRPDPAQPGRAALQAVTEDGDVVIHEIRSAIAATAGTAARPASSTVAHAAHTEFDATTNLLTLTGSPEVSSDGTQVLADRIVVDRATGDANATGNVRGSVAQNTTVTGRQAQQEPARFAAASAHLARSSGVVVLTGGNTDARLWTAAGQVEAPMIEADQRAGKLRAHAATSLTAGYAVRTALTQTPATTSAARANSAAGTSTAMGTGATRIFSRSLLYSTNSGNRRGGTAEFHGGVRVLQGGDTIVADDATANLQGGTMLASGGLESIAAQGHVRVLSADRSAKGDRLVYTAANRRAVLTGSAGAPPSARDAAQGTITGSQIVLQVGQRTGDNSFEVSGGSNAPVRTELDVPEKSGSGSSAGARSRRKPRPTP